MKILIQTKNLIDFPYKLEYKSMFHFETEKVNALVSEILYGGPTCYLVSGYRGAGKTSFLNRVEELCEHERIKNTPDKQFLFVKSNFSRFEKLPYQKTYYLGNFLNNNFKFK